MQPLGLHSWEGLSHPPASSSASGVAPGLWASPVCFQSALSYGLRHGAVRRGRRAQAPCAVVGGFRCEGSWKGSARDLHSVLPWGCPLCWPPESLAQGPQADHLHWFPGAAETDTTDQVASATDIYLSCSGSWKSEAKVSAGPCSLGNPGEGPSCLVQLLGAPGFLGCGRLPPISVSLCVSRTPVCPRMGGAPFSSMT